jgi:hypothetical protein
MSSLRTSPPTWLVLAYLAGSGCADFEEVPAETCGNLVVEATEQCDGQPNCGNQGAAACRFTCEAGGTACPGELACGADGVCATPTFRFSTYTEALKLEFPADEVVVGDLDGDRRDDLLGVGRSLRVRFGSGSSPLLESYEKPIRQPTGVAAFGELDSVAGLDVVIPTADGVFTLLGRGRSLEAVPYATVQALPDDGPRVCTPPLGWTACQRGDFDRDGRQDLAGFSADRDNIELRLARASVPVSVVIDTEDIVTDLTTGDLDGDGFDDIAFSTRSANGVTEGTVQVLFGAPQPQTQTAVRVLRARDVTGIAAADLDSPADGIADLGVARTVGGSSGVSLYLGNSSRDLSAPFRLARSQGALDVPYAVVVGEFVGGADSGVDVMAYARSAAPSDDTYFWWLRGLGNAQLEVGAVDAIDASELQFLTGDWKVADLLEDPSDGNGPDEVVGLSPIAPACAGPALTTAVPSARFTSTSLLRSACLDVAGDGWSARRVSVVGQGTSSRTLALAQRSQQWWFGETDRLDLSLSNGSFTGATLALGDDCRDPQIWSQTPAAGSFVSWVCSRGAAASIVGVRRAPDGATQVETLATVPSGATHLVGDFNGDGLTDLTVRFGDTVGLLVQCSVEDPRPGC